MNLKPKEKGAVRDDTILACDLGIGDVFKDCNGDLYITVSINHKDKLVYNLDKALKKTCLAMNLEPVNFGVVCLLSGDEQVTGVPGVEIEISIWTP